ncbi:F0F1 ATP synthase subunit delta [Colwellia sp. MB02u-10]|jgi:F-type H+-transporting ATPase subunit delta|uniref:F0F1 ATP synthase subunit delta n=1 Tax=Colwellia sp. MB02u-10 TaxID=2759828 RepID=UPI0015F62888|nr:F0F1 ATP synthase subunit delta [Colwellia sp. MB02u-10]MBA6342782.1 F0F1 ATP synthase subunit delta [Colwellia sp. MB02u-10]
MSELTTIARPYAKAAFDFAIEANTVENWLEMLVFAAQVANDTTIKSYLSGGASVEQAQDIFLKVCDVQLDSNGQNLIKVMAENQRLLVLPQVVTQFRELKAEHEKTVSVDVTSAVELTAEQKTTLCAALEKRLARKVKLNCNIDANVVSGLVIKAGDMVIDGSVRGKLSRLATIMQS